MFNSLLFSSIIYIIMIHNFSINQSIANNESSHIWTICGFTCWIIYTVLHLIHDGKWCAYDRGKISARNI